MPKHRARPIIIAVLVLACATWSVPGAWAGAPTDQLRGGIDRVFKILRDPEMAGDRNALQRQAAVLAAAGTIFDFGEMAKRSLGQHWAARTPAERTQFTALFTDLIQHSYINKVDQHSGAKMTFTGETVDGDLASVRTAIPLNNGKEMPLEYRMHNTDARWQVYDLSIDGISLLSNYRAQFNKIIRIDSYETLVTKLKSHQTEFSAPSASPSGKPVR
jgi:phospholipid transport system substrate-binding protein